MTDFPVHYVGRKVEGSPLTVPWAWISQFENAAQTNHGQTLTRLSERGGLTWSEMKWLIEGRVNRAEYPTPDSAVAFETACMKLVLERINAWKNSIPG